MTCCFHGWLQNAQTAWENAELFFYFFCKDGTNKLSNREYFVYTKQTLL